VQVLGGLARCWPIASASARVERATAEEPRWNTAQLNGGILQAKKYGYGVDELSFPRLLVSRIGGSKLSEGPLLKSDPINSDRPDRISEPVGNHGTDQKSIPRI
jgi:hypothetical protein